LAARTTGNLAPFHASFPLPQAASAAAPAEKKRKRASAAAGDAYTAEQLAGLQALFAKNEYAPTAAKTTVGAELGLELAQVKMLC
jgi:hypothetical protein